MSLFLLLLRLLLPKRKPTSLVISTSDPFAALSQAVKDDSSLVVTPSSIPSSATRGLDANLSSEGFEEVLKDSNDKLTMKKRISDSNEEGGNHEAEAMGMYLSYLLSFSFHPLSLPSSSFYVYLPDFLMQSLFTLHVHLQRFLRSLRL